MFLEKKITDRQRTDIIPPKPISPGEIDIITLTSFDNSKVQAIITCQEEGLGKVQLRKNGEQQEFDIEFGRPFMLRTKEANLIVRIRNGDPESQFYASL